ncbi:MAG: hypothetical protein ACJ72P_04425 [Nocardioides sp.]
MTMSYTAPSYRNLHDHLGHELAVVPEPCRLVTGTVLVLESLSTPWECEGVSHFEVRFTGPASEELLADFYRLRGGSTVFSLYLEPIARDLRFVHYVAELSEPTGAVPVAAGMPLAG